MAESGKSIEEYMEQEEAKLDQNIKQTVSSVRQVAGIMSRFNSRSMVARCEEANNNKYLDSTDSFVQSSKGTGNLSFGNKDLPSGMPAYINILASNQAVGKKTKILPWSVYAKDANQLTVQALHDMHLIDNENPSFQALQMAKVGMPISPVSVDGSFNKKVKHLFAPVDDVQVDTYIENLSDAEDHVDDYLNTSDFDLESVPDQETNYARLAAEEEAQEQQDTQMIDEQSRNDYYADQALGLISSTAQQSFGPSLGA